MKASSRRSAIVFPDKCDFSDQVTHKDSSTAFHPMSQLTTPHESFTNTLNAGEGEVVTTNVFSEEQVPMQKWKQETKRLVDSCWYSAVSAGFLVFTLFGDGVRRLTVPKDYDDVFTSMFTVTFCFFVMDAVVLSVLRSDYRWSVAFYFDSFATLTLLFDISWVWDSITAGLSGQGQKVTETVIQLSGKTSRVASSTLRLIKLMRLLRVLRSLKATRKLTDLRGLKSDSSLRERMEMMNKKRSFERKMKIFKNGKKVKPACLSPSTRHSISPIGPKDKVSALKRQKTFDKLYGKKRRAENAEEKGYLDVPVESRVSKLITSRTMKQVFALVFVSAFLMPYFITETYNSNPTSYEYGLELLASYKGSEFFTEVSHFYITKHQQLGNLATLIRLIDGNVILWDSGVDEASLRTEETTTFSCGELLAVLDLRTHTQCAAAMDLALVFFVCSMLLVSGLLVAHDFSSTVLFGMERMILLVRKIARNPLLLLSTVPSGEYAREQSSCCVSRTGIEYGTYEIRLLEEALRKIGVMLALGLGTAGCEIITRNIKASGRLDPLIPGKKVLAAFAFIGIRGFDTLTELMGKQLLVYLNKVSKVVHGSTERYQGAINRNLGEGYFAVWKFEEDDGMLQGSRITVNPYSMSVRLKSALALVAMIKSLVKVAKSQDLAGFLTGIGIRAVEPLLSSQLSVGLHVGWAFEGPVGSAFKIDATYLSPHVNKTARLESVTRLYEVLILASDDFFNRLDEDIRMYFRHIDTVVLKGTADPVMLYAFDLDLDGLGVSGHSVTKAKVVKQKAKVEEAFEFNYFNVQELFTQSENIAKIRSLYTPQFFRTHEQAMGYYLAGRWQEARDLFHGCLRLLPADGPTLNVLSYMERLNYQAPLDWRGVRILASK